MCTASVCDCGRCGTPGTGDPSAAIDRLAARAALERARAAAAAAARRAGKD